MLEVLMALLIAQMGSDDWMARESAEVVLEWVVIATDHVAPIVQAEEEDDDIQVRRSCERLHERWLCRQWHRIKDEVPDDVSLRYYPEAITRDYEERMEDIPWDRQQHEFVRILIIEKRMSVQSVRTIVQAAQKKCQQERDGHRAGIVPAGALGGLGKRVRGLLGL